MSTTPNTTFEPGRKAQSFNVTLDGVTTYVAGSADEADVTLFVPRRAHVSGEDFLTEVTTTIDLTKVTRIFNMQVGDAITCKEQLDALPDDSIVRRDKLGGLAFVKNVYASDRWTDTLGRNHTSSEMIILNSG